MESKFADELVMRGFAPYIGTVGEVCPTLTEKGSEESSMRSKKLGCRDVARFSGFALCCLLVLTAMPPAVEAKDQPEALVTADSLPPVVVGPYKIQVADVLDVTFFKTTQLNQSTTVGPDGEIFLPLVGRVNVLNRAVDDVTQELMERYGEEMVSPQITVTIREYSGMLVYVGGEVNQPGMRSYRGGLTLIQACMDAGGFATTARLKEVILIRKAPDHSPVGTVVNVKQILKEARLDLDVELAPADIVFVPRRKISNVNIWMEQYITNNIPFNLFLGYRWNF